MPRKKLELPQMRVPSNLEEAKIYEEKIVEHLSAVASKEEERAILEDEISSLDRQISMYCEALYAFADKNRAALLKGGREIAFPQGGKCSWVESKRVVLSRQVDSIIRSLRRLKLGQFIRPGKPTLNKQAMHQKPEELSRVRGVKLEPVELFTFYPHGRREYLQREPDKAQWSRKTPESTAEVEAQAA